MAISDHDAQACAIATTFAAISMPMSDELDVLPAAVEEVTSLRRQMAVIWAITTVVQYHHTQAGTNTKQSKGMRDECVSRCDPCNNLSCTIGMTFAASSMPRSDKLGVCPVEKVTSLRRLMAVIWAITAVVQYHHTQADTNTK